MTPTDPTPAEMGGPIYRAIFKALSDHHHGDALSHTTDAILASVIDALADAGYSIARTDTTIRMEIHDGLVTIDNGYDWPDGLSRRMLEEHVEQLIEDR